MRRPGRRSAVPVASASPLLERPANPVRSVMRVFASDLEDKTWFYDRGYCSATSRCSPRSASTASTWHWDWATIRRDLRDTYFYFAYPFFPVGAGL